MAAAAPIFMIASSAIGAVSSIAGGNERSAQYQSAAAASYYNAAVARQRAETVTAAYGQREEQQRRTARLVLGKQRAAAAQSGAGLGGSNADIERQSEVMAELDALNIRYEGQLESQGLLSQAQLDIMEGAQMQRNAKAARRAGFLGAAGSLLSGAGAYFGRYGSDDAGGV